MPEKIMPRTMSNIKKRKADEVVEENATSKDLKEDESSESDWREPFFDVSKCIVIIFLKTTQIVTSVSFPMI